MSEEQKSQSIEAKLSSLDREQLQSLLKDALKEKTALLAKNSKLENKYIQLFKQHRQLKKDHATFVTFFNRFFTSQANEQNEQSKLTFQEQTIGKYDLVELDKLAEQKTRLFAQRITDLEHSLQLKGRQVSAQLQTKYREETTRIIGDFQSKIKAGRQDQTKEVNSLVRDIQSLKKVTKVQSDELIQLKRSLDSRGEELSKLSKQKLKLEHHLNNIRKKQIAAELSPENKQHEQKMQIDRNQFLSMRQQVEALLQKRDNLKRELKEAVGKLEEERGVVEGLEREVGVLRKSQREFDQKYQLIRECTLEELENLILNNHSIVLGHAETQPITSATNKGKQGENEEIQRQYLKNVMVRYIKAESSGALQQSLTLLQIIATLLKLEPECAQALQQYKLKRRQWWSYVLTT